MFPVYWYASSMTQNITDVVIAVSIDYLFISTNPLETLMAIFIDASVYDPHLSIGKEQLVHYF